MGGGRLALFSRWRKCRRCCAFLETDLVLVVQVRSSVMCTPRNLVLLTLSTVELSMVSGGWSTGFLLKSITTRAVVLESGLGLESGLETFFYRLGLVLDSLVFGLGLVSDLVVGLAKCSSWSRPSPAIYAFFSLSKQRLACSANG